MIIDRLNNLIPGNASLFGMSFSGKEKIAQRVSAYLEKHQNEIFALHLANPEPLNQLRVRAGEFSRIVSLTSLSFWERIVSFFGNEERQEEKLCEKIDGMLSVANANLNEFLAEIAPFTAAEKEKIRQQAPHYWLLNYHSQNIPLLRAMA